MAAWMKGNHVPPKKDWRSAVERGRGDWEEGWAHTLSIKHILIASLQLYTDMDINKCVCVFMCWDSRGLIFVNGIPPSLWRHAGEQRATAVWCGASVPTFVKLLPVCVRDFKAARERRETDGERRRRARKLACVRCDRCDRCGRWSGTARCCCNRGQVPTCHWSVLMLTRGGGCTHLIDRKMAASRVCRWCWRHISFLLLSLSTALSLYLYLPPPSKTRSCRNTKQPFILSAISPRLPVFAQSCPLVHGAYICTPLRMFRFPYTVILNGDITCIIYFIIRL